jgi:hypothetical protein
VRGGILPIDGLGGRQGLITGVCYDVYNAQYFHNSVCDDYTINTEHSRLYHHKHIAKLVYSLSGPAFRRSRRFQNARTLSALFSK